MEFSKSENLKKNKRLPFARRRRKILAIYGHMKGKFTSFFIKISARGGGGGLWGVLGGGGGGGGGGGYLHLPGTCELPSEV